MKQVLRTLIILLLILALIFQIYYLPKPNFITIFLLWLSTLLQIIESQIKK